MIRRPPRSTQSRSSAASDVYKRQIIDNSHANSTVMSGGERIAIELSKQWSGSRNAEITVVGSNLTSTLWKKYILGSPISFIHINRLREDENLLLSYLKRVIKG